MRTAYRASVEGGQVRVDSDVSLETLISPPPEPPPVELAETDGEGSAPSDAPVDSPSATDEGHRTLVARLRTIVRPCVYFALSRVAVVFAALAGHWLAPTLRPFNALATGWDGRWYLLIAQHGYPHGLYDEGIGSRWAFFPAFPAAVRAIVDVTRLSYPNAALAASFVFGMTSAVAVFLALREVFGKVVADRSVLLYVFFPASYVLSMGYTEGLFLTAAGLCLFALSRKYWITAALFAALGSMTRNFGVILIACVVVAAIPALRRERKVRQVNAVVISVVPFLGWLLYSWQETGTPLAFLKAQQYWNGAHFMWFLTPLLALQHLLLHGFGDGQAVLATGALIFGYLGLALLFRARQEGFTIPLFWWVFTIGSVLAMMSPYTPTSELRYSMAAFPLFAAFAWKIRATWEGAIVSVLAMTQGALAVIVLVGVLHPHTSLIWP